MGRAFVRVCGKATTLVIVTLILPGWKYFCGHLEIHLGNGAVGVAILVAILDKAMLGAFVPTLGGQKEKALSRVPCRREKGGNAA